MLAAVVRDGRGSQRSSSPVGRSRRGAGSRRPRWPRIAAPGCAPSAVKCAVLAAVVPRWSRIATITCTRCCRTASRMAAVVRGRPRVATSSASLACSSAARPGDMDGTTAEVRPGEALTVEPSVHKPRLLGGGQTGPGCDLQRCAASPMTRVLRAASMTSLVITVRSLVRRDAFDSDERPVREPEAAAGDAGDCGDGLAAGEVGVVQGEAELAVKPPVSRLPQRARWPRRPAGPRRERGSAVTRNLLRSRDTRFRVKHLDPELKGG
jgi:hypothetical protein